MTAARVPRQLEQCDNFDERRKIRARLMTLMQEARARREQAARRRLQHQQQRDGGSVSVHGECSRAHAPPAESSRLLPLVYDQLRTSLSQSPQPAVSTAGADSGTESGGDDVITSAPGGGRGELTTFMDGLQTSLSSADMSSQLDAPPAEVSGSSPELVADVVSALSKLKASLVVEPPAVPQSPGSADVRQLVTGAARPGELVMLIDRLQSSLQTLSTPASEPVGSVADARHTVSSALSRDAELRRQLPPVPVPAPRRTRPQFRRPHTVGITREEFSEIRRSLDAAASARAQPPAEAPAAAAHPVPALPPEPSRTPWQVRRLSVGSGGNAQSALTSSSRLFPPGIADEQRDRTWKLAQGYRPPPPSWRPPPPPADFDEPDPVAAAPRSLAPSPVTSTPNVAVSQPAVYLASSDATRAARAGWRRPSRFARRVNRSRPHSIGSCSEDYAAIQQALSSAEVQDSVSARSQSGSVEHVPAAAAPPPTLPGTSHSSLPVGSRCRTTDAIAPEESGMLAEAPVVQPVAVPARDRKISHPLERQAAVERDSVDGGASPDPVPMQAVVHEAPRQFANTQASRVAYRDGGESVHSSVEAPTPVLTQRPAGTRSSLGSFLTKQMTKEYLEDSRRVSKQQVIASRIFTHQKALSERSNPPQSPAGSQDVDPVDTEPVSQIVPAPLQPPQQELTSSHQAVFPAQKRPITRYHSIETAEPQRALHQASPPPVLKPTPAQQCPAVSPPLSMSAAVSVPSQSGQIAAAAPSAAASQLPWVKQNSPWGVRRSSITRLSSTFDAPAEPTSSAPPWIRGAPPRPVQPFKPAVASERQPWQKRQMSLPPGTSLDAELGLSSDWREKLREEKALEQQRHEAHIRAEQERKAREKEEEAANSKRRMQEEYQQQQERIKQQQLRLQEQQETLRLQQEYLRQQQLQHEQQQDLELEDDSFRRQQQQQQQWEQQCQLRQLEQQQNQQQNQLQQLQSHQQLQQQEQQSRVHEIPVAVDSSWRQSLASKEPDSRVVVPVAEATGFRAPWSPRAARRTVSTPTATESSAFDSESAPRQHLPPLPKTVFSDAVTQQKSFPISSSVPGRSGALGMHVQSAQTVSTRSQMVRQSSEPVKLTDARAFRPPPLPKTRFSADGTVSPSVLSAASAPMLSRVRPPRLPASAGSLPGSPQMMRRGHPTALPSGGVLRSCSSDAVPLTTQVNFEPGKEISSDGNVASTPVASKTSASKALTSSSRSQLGKGKAAISPFDKFKQLDSANPKAMPRTDSNNSEGSGGFKLDPSLAAKAQGAKEMTLYWVQSRVRDYKNVNVSNFSTSWNDGMAFCALIHHFYPDAFDYDKLDPKNRRYNFDLAFKTADEKAGIYPLLDTDDMVMMKKPDWKCVFTYVQAIYRRLKDGP